MRYVQLFEAVASFADGVLLMYYFLHFMYAHTCFENLCDLVKYHFGLLQLSTKQFSEKDNIDFFMTQRPLVHHGQRFVEASGSHSDTPHSAVIFWTSNQLVAGTST
jgi:hypothetical protein